jgi:hypothetical protein
MIACCARRCDYCQSPIVSTRLISLSLLLTDDIGDDSCYSLSFRPGHQPPSMAEEARRVDFICEPRVSCLRR